MVQVAVHEVFYEGKEEQAGHEKQDHERYAKTLFEDPEVDQYRGDHPKNEEWRGNMRVRKFFQEWILEKLRGTFVLWPSKFLRLHKLGINRLKTTNL